MKLEDEKQGVPSSFKKLMIYLKEAIFMVSGGGRFLQKSMKKIGIPQFYHRKKIIQKLISLISISLYYLFPLIRTVFVYLRV